MIEIGVFMEQDENPEKNPSSKPDPIEEAPAEQGETPVETEPVKESETLSETEPETEPETESKTADGTDEEIVDLSEKDGADFAAHYQSAKEKDLKRLAEELESRKTDPAKRKKQKIMTAVKTIFLIVLIAVSIGIMFGLGQYVSGAGSKSFVDMVKGANLYYFLALVGVFILYIIVESMEYSYLIKISTGKFRLLVSIKTLFLGRYYDDITPLGTGGQPFQIYYLHKKKVPAGVATAVPLVKYIVHTFVNGVFAIVLFAITPKFLGNNPEVSGALTTTLFAAAWISFAVNLLIPTAMIIFSIFPKAGKKFIVKLVAFLHKIKIVKRKYSVTKKYVYEVGEYRDAMKLLIHKWWKLIPLILICAFQVVLSLSLPYFTAITIGNIQPTWELMLQIWCLSMVSYFSASLVPTPGSSGATEATSSLIFSTITVAGFSSVIGWVLFFWRFSTFYIFIVVGVCMNVFNMIRSAVRAKRAKRN